MADTWPAPLSVPLQGIIVGYCGGFAELVELASDESACWVLDTLHHPCDQFGCSAPIALAANGSVAALSQLAGLAPSCVARGAGAALGAACRGGHVRVCRWLVRRYRIEFQAFLISGSNAGVHRWLHAEWPDQAEAVYRGLSCGAIVRRCGGEVTAWWLKTFFASAPSKRVEAMKCALNCDDFAGASLLARECAVDAAALVSHNGLDALYGAIREGSEKHIQWFAATFALTASDLCPVSTLNALTRNYYNNTDAKSDRGRGVVIKMLGSGIAQWRRHWLGLVRDTRPRRAIWLAELLGVTKENSREDIDALISHLRSSPWSPPGDADEVCRHFGV